MKIDDVKHEDHGDYYFTIVRGSYMTCVACGKPKEYSTKTRACMHKCSENHEANRRGANRRHEEPIVQQRPWSERLADGFGMLGMGEGE